MSAPHMPSRPEWWALLSGAVMGLLVYALASLYVAETSAQQAPAEAPVAAEQ